MIQRARKSQAGSAFFIILIAIAMFAALAYAVFRNGGASEAMLSKEQARILAEELTSFSNTLQKTVATLRLRGCTEAELEFHNAYDVGNLLVNPGSPADGSCNLFTQSGGKVNFTRIDEKALDPSKSSNVALGYGLMVPTGQIAVEDVGTSANELVGVMPFVNRQICMAINDIAGITNTDDAPPQNEDGLVYGPFTGTYDSGTGGIGGDEVKGKSFGCVESTDWGAGYYFFYTVLIAR